MLRKDHRLSQNRALRAGLAALLVGTTVAVAPIGAAAQIDLGAAEGTYTLQDQNFGRFLENRDDGNVGTAEGESISTAWAVTATPDGYLIQSVESGLYLTANPAADDNADNYNVTVGGADGNVLWEINENDDGSVSIYNIALDRRIDADRRNLFNVDTSRQARPDTQWELTRLDVDAPGPDADPAPAGDAVTFTFENLQPEDGFFFTEPWVGLHGDDFDLFDIGDRVTPGLESLAEGGNTELLGEEFAQPGRLQATIGNGEVQFISPGETISGSIDVRNPQAYQYVSYASMFIPTNDAFFGNDDLIQIFDDEGNFLGPITIDVFGSDALDAGTEVNDAQGAAGFSLGFDGVNGGTSTDDPSGVAASHPGFDNLVGLQTAAGTTIGSDGGGVVEDDEPFARITIDLGDPINTQSAVGPLFDGSEVDGAPAPAPDPDPVPDPVPGDPIGAVFVGTNDLDDNSVAAFARAADGTLSPIGEFSTGGQGSTEFDGGEGLDPLISADSLVVTEDERFLLTVNAGSDEIVSFRINDDFSLTRVSVVDSGGVGPNSVAVDDGYVYVTNIDRDGLALGEAGTTRGEPNDEGNVVGFTLSDSGVLTPTGNSVDLDNRPANIDFSEDGDRIIVSSITSGSAALLGENSEASIYSFDVLRSGRLQLADTGTPTLRGNTEGRNLPSAIDFDITVQNGREFVVVTEAREFNSEGAPPALPALQAGSVTVYELGDDSSLTITEGDFAFTDGNPAAPNSFGADGQQLTACWIDFGHGSGSDIFYVSNAINASISSVRLADDGTLEVIETIAAQGVSGFDQPGQTGPEVFGTTDGFIDLDVAPDGDYLYQLEGLSGSIGVYELDGLGGLTQIQELSGELPEIDTQGLVAIGG